MYKFHVVVLNFYNIKCHYPGCEKAATHLEEMPLNSIFLCEEHKNLQRTIHISNNLPYSEGETLDADLRPVEDMPEESAE